MTYTKNTLRRVLIVLGAMTLLTAAACRNLKHKSPEERAEWVTKKITKELDLNESQKQTLAAIKTDLLAKHAAEKAERDNGVVHQRNDADHRKSKLKTNGDVYQNGKKRHRQT